MVVSGCRGSSLCRIHLFSLRLWFASWTISFLTCIVSHMYLFVDEPVGLVAFATPATFRPHPLVQAFLA
jgi:hypothetical protein